MSEIISLMNTFETEPERPLFEGAYLVEGIEGALADVRSNVENKTVLSMPIDQLSTLGAGVACLVPAFQRLQNSSGGGTEILYRLTNAGAGDALKVAKNGNSWGALKTAAGKSKLAQFQAVETPIDSSAAIAVDPVTVLIAVALFSIEQKLGSIAESSKQILSFLESEQEAEIEADVQQLSSIITKYKFNWNNDLFVSSNHKMVLDIERTALKHMNEFQKKVLEMTSSTKIVLSQAKVNEALNELTRRFKYYRLALYTFSLASFIEVVLSGNYKEENILLTRAEIEAASATYREVFEQCSIYLERLCGSSIVSGVLKGVGAASKAAGKLIDSIPKVRDGNVDEFLVQNGAKLQGEAALAERKVIESFAEISNPGVWVFVDKLEDLIRIYNRTDEIYFDGKQIYLVAG